MYNKKLDTVKWIITIFLLLVITAGTCFSVVTTLKDKNLITKPETEQEQSGTEKEQSGTEQDNSGTDENKQAETPSVASALKTIEVDSNPRISLAFSSAPRLLAASTTSATSTATVSKTITATVLPVDAPDKSVDWSIEWCTPIEGKEVTEYLTVTPESDGSLTATITAYKGFEGASAYVTATTRVGGFTATCLVAYDGAPESLSFNYNGKEVKNTGMVTLNAGTTNTIGLKLNNTLGAVGSKYGTFEITSIKGQGKFTMTKEYIVNGSVKSTTDVVFDLEQGSYTYTNEVTGNSETLTIKPEQFLTASVSGSTLTVKAIKSESSYVNGYPRTGYRFKYKGTYTDPRSGGVATNCMWYVTVKDTVSGQESLLYIDIQATINSISLSDTYLTF